MKKPDALPLFPEDKDNMPQNIIFDLSPTQSAFVHSTAHINHLTGPMGEGKTYCAIARLIAHGYRCQLRPLHAAIIRDTHENIKTSTVRSIVEVLGDRAVFKNDYKKLHIRAEYPVECDLFGIDDQASISKLQGPQYGSIWLEEPAPIYEKANAGLPYEVFEMALARCGRQAGSIPNLQLTQNPADEEHWSTELIDAPKEYMIAEDGTIITKETFHIQKVENKFLTPMQRAMNMAAFKSDPAKWARYVEGAVATVSRGVNVVSNYGENFHYTQQILPVQPGLPGVRMWDGYHHPTCIIAQYNQLGQLVVHDCIPHPGYGVKELIADKLLPLLKSPKYRDKITKWREIGDPSMRTPDQSTVRVTAAKTIETQLDTRFEPGPTRWPNRVEPINHALSKTISGGKPLIFISASAFALHKALKGGWHYKKDNNGNRIGNEAVKNDSSHFGDAFGYGVAILHPYSVREAFDKNKERADRVARMKRATSYGPGAPGIYAPRGANVRIMQ
jgi:hypothetical protein